MSRPTNSKGADHGSNRSDASAVQVVRTLRPLGDIEKMQSSLQLLHQFGTALVTCRFVIPQALIGSLESEDVNMESVRRQFSEAVARIVLEQPLLQVGQRKQDSAKPSWVQLSHLRLSDHIEWNNEAEKGAGGESKGDYQCRLDVASQNIRDSRFADVRTKPAWKVIIYHHHPYRSSSCHFLDTIFAWDHSVLDGIGAKIFHESLLRHLNSNPSGDLPLEKGDSDLLSLPDISGIFPPPQERLINYTNSLKYAASTLWTELSPSFFCRHGGPLRLPQRPLARWSPIVSHPFTSDWRTCYIDHSTVTNLVTACRKHNTTMTGLIHALAAASLALQLQNPEQYGMPNSFIGYTSVDHRRWITSRPKSLPDFNPNQIIMNLVSMMDHAIDAALIEKIRSRNPPPIPDPVPDITVSIEDEVWEIASRVRADMSSRIERGPRDDLAGLAKYVLDWRTQFRSGLKKPRTGAWMLTNLGVIDGDSGREEEEPWRITRATFAMSAEVTAPTFTISVVTVREGEMAVDVVWQVGTVNPALAKQFAIDLETWLNYFGSGRAD